MKTVPILLLCLGLALLPCPAAASDFKPTDLAALGAASVAKEACSAVFISEREASDYLPLASKFWMLPEDRTRIADVEVDRPHRRVTLTMTTGVKGVAVFTGATGCIALGPDGADPKVAFTPLPPVTVKTDVAWPQGDATPQGNWPRCRQDSGSCLPETSGRRNPFQPSSRRPSSSNRSAWVPLPRSRSPLNIGADRLE